MTIAAPRSGDLRDGLSVEEWAEATLWIRTDRAKHLPLRWTPSQRFLLRELRRAEAICAEKHVPVRTIEIKPRRAKWTTTHLARMVARGVTEPLVQLRYLAKTADDRPRQFASARYMYDHLDPRVQPPLLSPEAQSEMQWPTLGSMLDSATASSPRSGRGLGYAEQLLDEMAHVDSTREEQELLWAAMDPSSRYGAIWKLSTPNGLDNLFADHAHEALRGERDDVVIFMPHWFDEECRTLGLSDAECREVLETETHEESEALARFHGKYRAHNIVISGRERAERLHWRRARKRGSRLFLQEYPEDIETCWLSLGQMFFDPDSLAHQAAIARPPIRTALNGALQVFVEPVVRDPVTGDPHDYIVATDTSMGLRDGDPAMSLVLDFDTGEFVAGLKIRAAPQLMAELSIRNLCVPYNTALWAPEVGVEGTGRIALTHVRNTLGYSRIYRWTPPRDRTHAHAVREYGFPTNSQTRPVMLDDLRVALDDRAVQVNDLRALADFRRFKLRHVNGSDRYEAERGANDEGVVCAAIAWYVRKYGRIRPQCIWST